MELQFLGTGAGQPSKARNVSSLVLKLLDEINEVWMFDCGEGTQRQILETTIKPRKVKKIFITHMHGDHIFGLPGFLASRSFQSSEEQTDLEVYGPVGIKQYVMTSIRTSGTRLSYHVHFKEIDENSLGLVMEDDKFAVYADKLDHTIFCVGYRVVQKDLEGTLDAEALIAKDFISAPKKGKVITILGDTRKTNASVRLGLGADVLVHESTYGKGDEKIAKSHGHSTNMQAAQVAKDASAKRLLLNHVSARFLGRDIGKMAADAKTIFENTHIVRDLEEVEI